ncbi:MAG: peroxidase [Actinobacteria bacterium]|nr:peroxidase [Actinomycetota bacterium]
MARPADTQDFGYLFPELQDDPDNLLPERRATRNALVDLGLAMRDARDAAGGGNIGIPAAYTYFGQFVDHDITLEASSANLPQLFDPDLAPLPLARIETDIRNTRTAMLELDSVYGELAPRVGARMKLGKVTDLGNQGEPFRRPPGKGDNNDVPREPRDPDPRHDRAALIGDPRNDENLIVAQMHVAFLRAHNELVDRDASAEAAKRRLRRHYQHIVLHDFLRRIANTDIVDDIVRHGNRIFPNDEFFMPLEFSAAAYRFGHSMIRRDYEFNINFQPATLDQLFTFTALSGQLGDNDTLPENWIIQWENFVDTGASFNHARRIDTKLVEPLFELTDLRGRPLPGDRKSLAVRNLLRGYLLRLPTGQAVARRLRRKLEGVREITVLGANEIKNGVDSEQAQILEAAGFLQHTPLWYYILAEAAILTEGRRLGPVGSTIVAEVLIGLLRRSQDSILNVTDWQPNLPSETPGEFTLSDLLRFAGVL